MNFRYILGGIALLFCVAYGCQKAEVVEQVAPTFVEKTFMPAGEAEAKEKVLAFLNAVKSSEDGVGERTTFSDVEVNEGRWILEGAGNYEKNVNFPGDGSFEHTEKYLISVNNITANGILKMVGSNMTSEYASLLTSINLDETSLGQTAVAMDLKILSSNSSETSLEATVAFKDGPDPPQSNLISWYAARPEIENGVEAMHNGNPPGCIVWMPDIYLVVWNGGTPFYATDRIEAQTTSIFAEDYQEHWIPTDVLDAEAKAVSYLSSQSQGNQYSWNLERVEIFPIGQETSHAIKRHIFQVIIATQYSYCY